MKRNKLAKKMTAGLLTGAMIMSMSTNVFAATTVGFKKQLDMTGAPDAKVPGVEFSFTIEPGEATNEAGKLAVKSGIQSADEVYPKILPAEFDDTNTIEGGVATESVSVDFSNVIFTEPGIYRYEITESAFTGVQAEMYNVINDSQPVRYLDVYVERIGGDCVITGSVLLNKIVNPTQIQDDEGYKADYGAESKSEGYTNTYNAADLSLDKVVEGTMGDKTEMFEFSVEFTAPVGTSIKYNDGADKTIEFSSADDGDADGLVTMSVSVSMNDGTDPIVFKDIPMGATYKITETNPGNGYTTQYQIGEKASVEGTVMQDEEEMGTTDVKVTFTNTKNAVTPTGIAMTFAPYAVMVAFAGVFAVMFLRKKREDF